MSTNLIWCFKHPWFLSSRSSRTDPKRDWYVWRPARYTETGERLEPNNWVSEFGGNIPWTFVAEN